ncbi:OmpA family protein [Ketobacter nezhaii]|uniref:OmpA family protein n=1 Tax=Ketobacter sp. MCCC 1A13808 TaxID=2602738 RepID=UPI0018DB0FE3|nr:OmpA family protein [Ketobacter sp. MCCC 1A13808]
MNAFKLSKLAGSLALITLAATGCSTTSTNIADDEAQVSMETGSDQNTGSVSVPGAVSVQTESEAAVAETAMQRAAAEDTTRDPETVLEASRKIVYFNFDSAELTTEAEVELDDIVEEISANDMQSTRIYAAGYTDSMGPEVYNQSLSEERALSVIGYLKRQLDASEWKVDYFGEEFPSASNDSEQGREKNRRVVIEYVSSNNPDELVSMNREVSSKE